MKTSNLNLLYMHLNDSERYLISHGISLLDFYQSMTTPPSLLLLQHPFEGAELHLRTLLHYIEQDQFFDVIDESDHRLGDISCLDFDGVDALEELEGQEIAELLYFSHLKRPLRSAFFQKLNNRYAYLSHDDGWFNKIYFQQLDDFYELASSLITKKIKAGNKQKRFSLFRKSTVLEGFDLSTLESLFDLWQKGAVMDFNTVLSSKGKNEIPVYVIGDYWNMDEMLEAYRRIKKTPDLFIRVNRKEKRWMINGAKP